jgi:hypothetical protein
MSASLISTLFFFPPLAVVELEEWQSKIVVLINFPGQQTIEFCEMVSPIKKVIGSGWKNGDPWVFEKTPTFADGTRSFLLSNCISK